MSSKKSEQAVLGRRLRPIYDAIDAGQNKKAVQEADKILKKHPATSAAKALKALALIRIEKRDEATPLLNCLEQEIKEGKYDDSTLQALIHCFKESYEPYRIVFLYENLIQLYPNNEQLLSNLFLAYTRVRNYKQQQKIGMQLYKEFNSIPYYMWTVMSIVMQALNDPKMGSIMYYPLAEKMLEKITDSHTFQNEETDLHLMVLEGRGKVNEVIEHLEKDLKQSVATIPGTRAKHRLDQLYTHTGNHNAVVARAICNLEDEYNDWAVWTYLYDSAFIIMETSDEDSRNKMINRLIEMCCRASQTSQVKSSNQSIVKRGPCLARLELMSRLQSHSYLNVLELKKEKLGNPLQCMKELVECSYSKPFCFADLKCYLHVLNQEQIHDLLAHLGNIQARDNAQWADILKERIVVQSNISRNYRYTNDERFKAVAELIQKLPTNTESGPEASAYAQIIATHLWSVDGNSGPGWNTALLLSVILEHIQLKYTNCDSIPPVLLCRLYGMFGNTLRVYELCRQLDVKYIQRDSLGYLQFFLAARFGRFKTAILQYASLSAFYDQNEREVSECVVNAYKNGQFSQVPKLGDFLEKCSRSVFSVATDVMSRSLSSCFAIDALEVVADTLLGDDEVVEWDKLSDNRDFGLIESLTGFASKSAVATIQSETFNELVDSLKIHDLLCRAVGILSKETVNQETLHNAIDTLIGHIHSCKKKYESLSNEKINQLENFNHYQISQLISDGCLDVPLLMLEIGLVLVKHKSAGLDDKEVEHDKSLQPLLDDLPSRETLESLLKVITPEYIDGQISAPEFPKLLQKCANLLRFALISKVAVKFMMNFLLTFGWSNKSSKAKKEKYQSSLTPVQNRFREYTEALYMCTDHTRQIIMKLEMEVRRNENLIPPVEWPSQLIDVSGEFAEAEKRLRTSLRHSYYESISEMLHAIGRGEIKSLSQKVASVKIS
ncbi:n-acetyltransferase B complex (NatB) non catalytic subunit domain-containing protein [Ditylenchus destructor]|nr:n-acetyltransferase B complex (NatB) non catalytic subunit domain-containing protein [Ditylenchus destructor]